MSFVRVVFADRHRTTPRTLTVVAPAPMLSGALRKPIIQYRKAHPTVNLTLIDRPRTQPTKGGAHAFVAPADGSGASGVNRKVMMGMMLDSCVC